MVRHITPDESDDNIQWGRYLHEHSYEREKKEIEIGNIKLDLLQKEDGRVIVGEVKKSGSTTNFVTGSIPAMSRVNLEENI